jgi:hypothetical protein
MSGKILKRDGRLDLATANFDANSVSVLPGEGMALLPQPGTSA